MIANLIITTILLAVPTDAERIAAYNAIATMSAEVRDQGRPTTLNTDKTRFCIPFKGAKPNGLVTVRFKSIGFKGRALSIAKIRGKDHEQDPSKPGLWGVAEVQVVPTTVPVTPDAKARQSIVFPAPMLETRESPIDATCEVLFITEEDPAVPFACACSTGTNCTTNGQPAPLGYTLYPEENWTGAGCKPRPCMVVGGPGFTPWPAECPKPADPN